MKTVIPFGDCKESIEIGGSNVDNVVIVKEVLKYYHDDKETDQLNQHAVFSLLFRL